MDVMLSVVIILAQYALFHRYWLPAVQWQQQLFGSSSLLQQLGTTFQAAVER